MRKGLHTALAVAVVMTIATGCSTAPKPGTADTHATAPAPAPATEQALAVLEAKITATQGNTCQGTVRFEAQKDGSVKVTADLSGLDANTVHGIHVHET